MKAMIFYILPVLLLARPSAGTLEVRTGLLPRLVQFYKHSFLHDLVEKAPVKVDVSIQPAPPGYEDPQEWDYDSVLRLLELMRASDSAPTRRLHEELSLLTDDVVEEAAEDAPSRRYMGMGRLHKARQRVKRRMQRCAGDPSRAGYPKYCPRRKHIPRYNRKVKSARDGRKLRSRKQYSLNRLRIPSIYVPNDLYYDDMLSLEDIDFDKISEQEGGFVPRNNTIRDEEILIITNPVEAKLPSGHISIGMLRRILEARAEAARVMPTRSLPTTQNSTDTDITTESGNGTVSGNETITGSDGDNSTAAGNSTAGGDIATGTTVAGEGKEDGGDGKKDGDEAKPDGDGEDKPDEEKAGEEAAEKRLRSGKRQGRRFPKGHTSPKVSKGRKSPKGLKGRKSSEGPKGRKGSKGQKGRKG